MDHSNPVPLAALAVAAPEGGQRGSTGAPPDADAVQALRNPALDPLFWPAERLGAPSAWWQHVPFAHWVVPATAPRVLVELGTHAGVSYAALCQAVARGRLDTSCHAVDTWRGDPHAGEYGEEVYDEFRRFHEERYGGFSTLLRRTFDAALDRFAEGSVDLLHIDGLHTYGAARHDFESWTPKLSNRAVVLFHATNERGGDFGVWRLWGELRERFRNFEFLHGHGLGVLAVGDHAPPEISALCALEGSSAASVRERFARLGERWLHETRERMRDREMERQLSAAAVETMKARADAERAEAAVAEAAVREEHAKAAATRLARTQETMRAEAARRAAAARLEAAEAIARTERAEAAVAEAAAQANAAAARAERAEAETAETTDRAERAEAAAARFHHAAARAVSERDALLASTAWRATRPFRAVGERMPTGLRRAARGGAKLAWWTVTLKLPRMLRQRRRALQVAAERTAAAPPGEASPPL